MTCTFLVEFFEFFIQKISWKQSKSKRKKKTKPTTLDLKNKEIKNNNNKNKQGNSGLLGLALKVNWYH